MPERCSLSPDCLRVLREPAASAALSVNLESLRSEQVFSGIRRTNVRTHPRTHKSRAPSSRAEYSPRTSECQRIRIEIRRTARKRERLNRFVTRRDAFRGEAECQESLRLPERERERERARVRERESERERRLIRVAGLLEPVRFAFNCSCTRARAHVHAPSARTHTQREREREREIYLHVPFSLPPPLAPGRHRRTLTRVYRKVIGVDTGDTVIRQFRAWVLSTRATTERASDSFFLVFFPC